MNHRLHIISALWVMALAVLSCSSSDLGDLGNFDLGGLKDVGEITLPNLEQLSPRKEIDGSGNVVEESRILKGVNDISLKSIGSLHVELGESEGLRIQAEDNLIQYFRVDVNDNKLIIGVQPGAQLHPTQPVNFFLTVRTLEALGLYSSGDIETARLEGRDLAITLDGSGNLNIPELSAQLVKVRLPGSGNITLAGVVQEQDIVISGSGNYRAAGLESGRVRAKISGSGSIEVRALDTLTASISGSGTVRYSGNPEINQDISGSGEVVRLEE
jgi:hypothetical protein